MNDTLKTIAERYSCRDFTPQAPTEEQLQAIARAGLAAPSGKNRQAWRIIAVRDGALIRQMDEEGVRVLSAMEDQSAYNMIMGYGGKLFYGAPAIFMLPIDPAEAPGALLDCGILSQNIALAATSLGLASCICGMARLAFMGEKGDAFRERLGFPQGYEFGVCVLVGYAAAPGKPHRLREEKLHFIG